MSKQQKFINLCIIFIVFIFIFKKWLYLIYVYSPLNYSNTWLDVKQMKQPKPSDCDWLSTASNWPNKLTNKQIINQNKLMDFKIFLYKIRNCLLEAEGKKLIRIFCLNSSWTKCNCLEVVSYKNYSWLKTWDQKLVTKCVFLFSMSTL